jgi:hypothetical protein
MRWAIACLALGCATSQTGYHVRSPHPGQAGVGVRVTDAFTKLPMLLALAAADGDFVLTDEGGRAFLPLAPGVHWVRVTYGGVSTLMHVVALDGVTDEVDVTLDFSGIPFVIEPGEKAPMVNAGSTRRGIEPARGDELLVVKWAPWAFR